MISLSLWIIQLILLSLSPLFGYDASIWLKYLFWFALPMAIGYFMTVLSAVFLFIMERKRIGKLKFFTALATFLLWPLFLLLSVVQDVAVLFIRKLEWKTIPHSHNLSDDIQPQESEKD